MLGKISGWVFRAPTEPASLSKVVVWWELRRIPYNVVIGSIGFLSYIAFFFFITHAHVLAPGEDAEEPIALLAAPILINVCYTLGWIVECSIRLIRPNRYEGRTVVLFKAGCAFSLFVVLVPSVYWGGYLILQHLHILSR